MQITSMLIRSISSLLLNKIEDLLASANAKLVGVPRFMTFCHINDYDYITPQEIGFMVADHSFSFKDNFDGSVARCRPKNSITSSFR